MQVVLASGALLFALSGLASALPAITTSSTTAAASLEPSSAAWTSTSAPTAAHEGSTGTSSGHAASITPNEFNRTHLELRAAGSPAVLFSSSGPWLTIPCDAPGLTNDLVPIQTRWKSADAQEAWTQAMAGFVKDQKDGSLNGATFDTYLWNAFHQGDYPQCWNYESGSCGRVTCGTNSLRPASFLIMDSISALNTMVKYAYNSILGSQSFITNTMHEFVTTFTHLPSQVGEQTLKIILDSLTFGVGIGSAFSWNVFIREAKWFADDNYRGAWKDIFNGAVGFGMTAGKDSMSSPQDQNTHLEQALSLYQSQFLNQTYYNLAGFLQNTLEAKDQASRDYLTKMVTNGAIYDFLTETISPAAMQTAAAKLFWGRLITVAWSLSPEKMNPFILRVDRSVYKCGDPVKTPAGDKWDDGFNLGTMMSPSTAKKTQICDPSGNTWFLLNAVRNTQCQTSNPRCISTQQYFPFQELAGGTTDNLDGKQWAGITLKDIIMSSYGGFLANGGKNGYSMPDSSSLAINDNWSSTQDAGLPFFNGIQTPGFFNLTVCLNADEARNNAAKGHTPVCGTVPNKQGVSQPENDRHYTPGSCGIHFTQIQPKSSSGKDINPLDQWQLAITIIDGAKKVLTTATKQPVEGGLVIDSNLPYKLTVDMGKGKDDLCFWYSDQYWCINKSASHQCKYDDKFDGTTHDRQGDCSFTCNNPTKNPPASATTNLPKSPVTAFKGTGTGYVQAVKTATYARGWCGLHIRQYQRNEKANYENASPDYALELQLYDSKKKLVAYTDKTNAAAGVGVPIKGPLPKAVLASSGNADKDPVSFVYGTDKWFTHDKQCHVGGKNHGLQNGVRDIDCGFSC